MLKKLIIIPIVIISINNGFCQKFDSLEIQNTPFEYQSELKLGQTVFFVGMAGALISTYLIANNEKIPEAYTKIFIGTAYFGIGVQLNAIRKIFKNKRRKVQMSGLSQSKIRKTGK